MEMEKPLLENEEEEEMVERGEDGIEVEVEEVEVEVVEKDKWPFGILVMFRLLNMLGVWCDEDLEILDREMEQDAKNLRDVWLFDQEKIMSISEVGEMEWKFDLEWIKGMKPQGEGWVWMAKLAYTIVVWVWLTSVTIPLYKDTDRTGVFGPTFVKIVILPFVSGNLLIINFVAKRRIPRQLRGIWKKRGVKFVRWAGIGVSTWVVFSLVWNRIYSYFYVDPNVKWDAWEVVLFNTSALMITMLGNFILGVFYLLSAIFCWEMIEYQKFIDGFSDWHDEEKSQDWLNDVGISHALLYEWGKNTSWVLNGLGLPYMVLTTYIVSSYLGSPRDLNQWGFVYVLSSNILPLFLFFGATGVCSIFSTRINRIFAFKAAEGISMGTTAVVSKIDAVSRLLFANEVGIWLMGVKINLQILARFAYLFVVVVGYSIGVKVGNA